MPTKDNDLSRHVYIATYGLAAIAVFHFFKEDLQYLIWHLVMDPDLQPPIAFLAVTAFSALGPGIMWLVAATSIEFARSMRFVNRDILSKMEGDLEQLRTSDRSVSDQLFNLRTRNHELELENQSLRSSLEHAKASPHQVVANAMSSIL